jgi:GT2 family glycosyltransferase
MANQDLQTVAVLITCHNRKSTTLACLKRLISQALPPGISLKVYLVDDGSSDGTSEAVRELYPVVRIIRGDGTLFWCNGMRLAWKHAAESDPNYYFWLNDDTMLHAGALSRFIGAAGASNRPDCIIVGSCRDAETGVLTYGGEVRLGRHPGITAAVQPDNAAMIECDTFNGNCVLVSRAAYKILGSMRSFKHSTGDTDYGYKARRRGIPQLVLPNYVADCSRNPPEEHWLDPNHPPIVRLRKILGKKVRPPGDWWRFLWAHAGLWALIYWPKPYLRALLGTKRQNPLPEI